MACLATGDAPNPSTSLRRRPKGFAIGPFSSCNLYLRQSRKLLFERALGQSSAVLMKKAEQEINGPVRHIYNVFDARAKLIVLCEELGFARQVDVDHFHDAAIEILCMSSRIEKAIKIARVVQNPH